MIIKKTTLTRWLDRATDKEIGKLLKYLDKSLPYLKHLASKRRFASLRMAERVEAKTRHIASFRPELGYIEYKTLLKYRPRNRR